MNLHIQLEIFLQNNFFEVELLGQKTSDDSSL